MSKIKERIVSPWGPVSEGVDDDPLETEGRETEIMMPFGFPTMEPPEARVRKNRLEQPRRAIGFPEMARISLEPIVTQPESQDVARHNPFE